MSGSWRFFGAVLLMAMPSGLLADEPDQPDRAAIFQQLDANRDGLVTEDEVNDEQRQLFKRLLRTSDKDADGKLSQAEFLTGLKEDRPEPPPDAPPAADRLAAFLQARPAQIFKRLDANGDGKLEISELPEQARPRLEPFVARFDADGDNALSIDEFRKGQQVLRSQAGIAPAGGAPGVPLMSVLDLDGDGALSKSEIASAAESLKKLDRNGDGSLSREELASAGPAAGAGKPAPRPNQLLKRLEARDKNGDGKWSADELPPVLRGEFEKLDANNDGFIDSGEVKQSAALIRNLLRPGQGQKKSKKKPAV